MEELEGIASLKIKKKRKRRPSLEEDALDSDLEIQLNQQIEDNHEDDEQIGQKALQLKNRTKKIYHKKLIENKTSSLSTQFEKAMKKVTNNKKSD